MASRTVLGLRVRKGIAAIVLGVGWLTTIATSAVEDPSCEGEIAFTLEPGEARRVEIVVNEAAMDHVRIHEDANIAAGFAISIRGDASQIVPDDDAFPPQPSPGFFQSGSSACPDSGECRLGFTIEAPPAEPTISDPEEATRVYVDARASVQADTSFLFPADRSFPEDAAILVTVE